MIIFRKAFWLLMLLAIFSACHNKDQNNGTAATDKMQIEVYIVKEIPLNNIIKTSGSILPNEKIQLRSEVSGRVQTINFKEGTHVNKGMLLIQVDDAELRAQMKKFEAQLRIAKEDENRKKQLLAINGVSQEVYDAALTKVEELQADIDLTHAQIRNSRIEAPFDGIIGLREVSQGAYVSPGDIISTLVQLDPVKLEFNVPERYAIYIHRGMEVEFTISGSAKTFKASVYATDPEIDPNTRSLKIRALTPNKEGILIPGAFTDLSINLERIDNALMIPTLAMVPLLNSQNVYVVKNGAVKLVEVETGIRTEEMVQVTKGLELGDSVATTGLLALRDQMPVGIRKVAEQDKKENE